MTNDKNILIKNIYYMLAYAFQVLKRNNYASIASEKFEHIEDLFAEILSRGISYQLKQGLYREYVPRTESLPTMKGKIDITKLLNIEYNVSRSYHANLMNYQKIIYLTKY